MCQIAVFVTEFESAPLIPQGTEYDDFPRGRVVFDTKSDEFIIYIDDRIRLMFFINKIMADFHILSTRCIIRLDPHYRSHDYDVG
jgi:hypothetical protein